MCDELPEPIEIRLGERTYPVEPLVEVEVTDRRTAELLSRYRRRLATAGEAPDGSAG